MIKRNFVCVFACLLYTIIISSQEIKFNKDILLGKWNSYKVTTLEGEDGSDFTFDEKPFNKKIMMNFISSKSMLLSINDSKEYRMEYIIKKNKIILESKEYTIQALTNTSLTLKEEGLLGILIYMKKDDG